MSATRLGRRTPRHALRWRPTRRGGLDGVGRPQRCLPQRAAEHGEDQPAGHACGRAAKDALTRGGVVGFCCGEMVDVFICFQRLGVFQANNLGWKMTECRKAAMSKYFFQMFPNEQTHHFNIAALHLKIDSL